MYSVTCTVYSVTCTVYSVTCTVYSVVQCHVWQDTRPYCEHCYQDTVVPKCGGCRELELETKVHAKVRNHREGPY